MTMTDAPLFTDVSPGPEDGAAWWMHASDGVRLRIAAWARDATKGTVLLFPGRTEYVEKYGPAATDLAARGFATVSIDWRGQGLADRLLDDPRIGHVGDFQDYQKDVATLLKAARTLDMPKPYFLLAHSMGGAIGLRSVYEDLPVQAAAFSAPMWGIKISKPLQPAAWVLTRVMPAIGQGGRLAPTTVPEPYVLKAPFEDNMLTTDPDMHSMMRDQVSAHPDLCLGGPSYIWLGEAIEECNDLAVQPSPKIPCKTFLGDNERIVHTGRIHDRMQRWNDGDLKMIPGAEHEVLMEQTATRNAIFDDLAQHFEQAAA